MSQMWEVVHRLVAEAGLRLAPSRPVVNRHKGPQVAPPEEPPALQSESDPRLRGEPLPDDDAPGPSCCPPRSAPNPPTAPASSSGPSTTPAPAPVPPDSAPPATEPPAPSPPALGPPDPGPPAVPDADEPASAPRRMPVQLLRLPPSAYASTHDHPLSPRSKRAAEHLVRDYAGRSEAWWGTFIEVWDSFMVEVQRLGADPAA